MTLEINANTSVENIISYRVEIKIEYIKAFKTLCKEAVLHTLDSKKEETKETKGTLLHITHGERCTVQEGSCTNIPLHPQWMLMFS